jgi:uncharacterized membrane protein
VTRWRQHLPTVVIGVGVGGFFDGIVLHQVLQWHHLASNVIPADTLDGLRSNTFFDGLFHQAMWLVTVAGVALLYLRLVNPAAGPRPTLLGGVLLGFGIFNIADSVVFHWGLGLHNIRPGPDWLLYDLGYFGWGVAMAAIGLWLIGRQEGSARTPGSQARSRK